MHSYRCSLLIKWGLQLTFPYGFLVAHIGVLVSSLRNLRIQQCPLGGFCKGGLQDLFLIQQWLVMPGWSTLGPWSLLLVSLTDASDSKCMYSVSSFTMPDPLLGLVMTTTLPCFHCLIAVNSVFGRCGACRSRFQYAFSKLALTWMLDTRWGMANFRP